MTTNIERLHKVVTSNHYLGRQSGYTFAQCHNVASALQLGNSDIVCLITVERDVMYLLPMLEDVLSDCDIEIVDVRNNRSIIHTSLGKIRLISTGKSEHTEYDIQEIILTNHRLRGLDDYVLVTMGHFD